jgi:hypothetical protein
LVGVGYIYTNVIRVRREWLNNDLFIIR